METLILDPQLRLDTPVEHPQLHSSAPLHASAVQAHPGAATFLLLLAPLLGAASVGRRRLRGSQRPSATRRVHTLADGRCLLRAVVHQVDSGAPESILHNDSIESRTFLRDVRARASRKVVEACEADEQLAAIVAATFPDEKFESFEEWANAMEKLDDTGDAVSGLWQGGGSWLVFGLGQLYGCTISVTPLFPLPGGGFSHGVAAECVAAGARRVGLAMLMNDDGLPDHFDVLEEEQEAPRDL